MKDLISPALPPQKAQPLFPLPQTHELWFQADGACAYPCRGNLLPLEKEWVGSCVVRSLYSFGRKARSSFNAVLTDGHQESALCSLLCGTGVLRPLLHYSNIPELHTWAVPRATQLNLAHSQSTIYWQHLKDSKKCLLRLKGSTESLYFPAASGSVHCPPISSILSLLNLLFLIVQCCDMLGFHGHSFIIWSVGISRGAQLTEKDVFVPWISTEPCGEVHPV